MTPIAVVENRMTGPHGRRPLIALSAALLVLSGCIVDREPERECEPGRGDCGPRVDGGAPDDAAGEEPADVLEGDGPLDEGPDAPPRCQDGAAQVRECGFNDNGEQRWVCEADRWREAGACDDPDECRNGHREVEACEPRGGRSRARSRLCARGRWGPFSGCGREACPDPAVPDC